MTKPREECGIFGVFGNPDAAALTYLGLYALQHRGQESAGIVSNNGGRQLIAYRNMGKVVDVFSPTIIQKLVGSNAIGHVRYSTTGSSRIQNAQPIKADYHGGSMAVAHNGNLVNASSLRRELELAGSIFSSSSDSEVLVHLIARSQFPDFPNAVIDALQQVDGAGSFLFLDKTRLVAARDPRGFRPLMLGKLGGSWVLASETCALDIISAKFVREIEPGEILVIEGNELVSHFPFKPVARRLCIFEFIYFSRPDSNLDGKNISEVRKRLGARLAREHPVEADVVIPVPDSSNSIALGFALESGIPFDHGLIRNHYIGRTFIEPFQDMRDISARIKYNPVRATLESKRVVVVDDSIVRGTTSAKIVDMIRKAGAHEVHMRIGCPPWMFPCYFGVDTPTRNELTAAVHSLDYVRESIGVDTLGYLSEDGMKWAVGNGQGLGYCTACFSGDYPCEIPEELTKASLEVGLFNGDIEKEALIETD